MNGGVPDVLDLEKQRTCRVESRDIKMKARRERRTSAGIPAAKGRTKILSLQLNVAGNLVT